MQATKTSLPACTKKCINGVKRLAGSRGYVVKCCESRSSAACSVCPGFHRLVGANHGWRHCRNCGRYGVLRLLHHRDDRMNRTFARDKNACVNIAQAAISILLNGVPSSQVQQFADEQNYYASGMTIVSKSNATGDRRRVSQIRTCLRSTRGCVTSGCSNRSHMSFALLCRDSIDRCDKHHHPTFQHSTFMVARQCASAELVWSWSLRLLLLILPLRVWR